MRSAVLEESLSKLGRQFAERDWRYIDMQVGGSVEKYFAWPAPAGDNIMICVHRGKQIRELFHRQDFFFFNFAYSGDYGALSGSEDNRIVVHENECYIGQPFSGYALSTDSEEEIIIIGVLIEREAFFKIFLPAISADARLFHFFLKPQTDKYADEYIRLRFDDSCNVRTLLEMMVIEYASPGEDTQAILQPLALALLMQVARRCRASRAEPEGEAPAGKIIRFMGEHAGALKLRDVAARFSYHPNYVSGLLRRVTGKTFSEISLEQRMRRAEILLKCTKLSVEDIALMLGYSSSSNFYKAFREYFGKSPREYLKA